MSASKQAPAVVIATRNYLITDLASNGGDRMTQPQREALADWLISSGYLAETYFDKVAAAIDDTEEQT